MTIIRTLGTQRMLARQQIDQAAEDVRMRRLTPGSGQAMVYAEKLSQAMGYISAHATDPLAPVPPYVEADVDVAGGTALEAAQAIVEASVSFHLGPGPAIERARRAAKAAVGAAENVEALKAALDAGLSSIEVI